MTERKIFFDSRLSIVFLSRSPSDMGKLLGCEKGGFEE